MPFCTTLIGTDSNKDFQIALISLWDAACKILCTDVNRNEEVKISSHRRRPLVVSKGQIMHRLFPSKTRMKICLPIRSANIL